MADSGASFGRYLLGERLGKGGMGEVYLALQTGIGSFEKPMALKLLLPHLSEKERAVRMFLDEARLAARMNHPNITQIFDVGVVEGRYFIAMELVKGVSLSKLCSAMLKQNQLPATQLVLFVARCLLEALHHAHEQRGSDGQLLGLIHRDVTPHNVLVSVDGVVKLADFGIAQAQGTLTEENKHALMGKLAYFAPEQLRGETVDRRADLYAAALTIYNFATLSQPYRKESTEETLEAILEQDPPDVQKTRRDLPIALTEALAKAFNRKPDQRFTDARAFADAIPTPMLDASRLLAGLVRAHCNQDLEVLEAKTNHALALNRSTSSDGAATPQNEVPTGPQPSRHTLVLPNRSPALYAAALVALLTLVGGMYAAVKHFSADAPAPVAETNAPAGAGLGYLTVDAEPWATVWISGAQVGETPLSSVPLKAGEVDVELKNPETGKSKRVHVTITAGQKSFVKEVLR